MKNPLVHKLIPTALLVAVLVVPPVSASNTNGHGGGGNLGNRAVMPPVSHPYGHSYSDWTATWWQWAYGLPATGHPLFDETGAAAGAGQSGPVWFLGGVFNVSGSATRTVTVPAGTSLFFPIINVEWDNICPPTDPPLTLAQLQATAKQVIDGATDLECDLDGVTISNVGGYRFTSVFDVTVPTDNLFTLFGCPTSAGNHGPLANDGYYLMLKPLSVGAHELHFHGRLPAFGDFTLDIVYHLTVAPEGAVVAMPAGISASSTVMSVGGPAVLPRTLGAASAGNAAQAPAQKPRHATWGSLKLLYR